jgi:hypothetical protein
MLIEHMSNGLSFESFGAVIDKNPDTLHQWAKTHPDFSESLKRGEIKSLFFWEKVGIAGTVGKLPRFNVAGWINNMSNRFRKRGWRRGDFVEDRPPVDDNPEVRAAIAQIEREDRSKAPAPAASPSPTPSPIPTELEED